MLLLNKNMIMLIIFVTSLIAISAVSAADNDSSELQRDVGGDNIVVTSNQNVKFTSTSEGKLNTTGSFTDLQDDINGAGDTLEITKDYRNDNYTDRITIFKDNFVINGNNHTIDGNGHRIFLTQGSNITINDLTIINAFGNLVSGAAIYNYGDVVLNNVTFVNNIASNAAAIFNSGGVMELHDAVFINNSAYYGGAIGNSNGVMELHDAVFINNSAYCGSAIFNRDGSLFISNTFFSSGISDKWGQIFSMDSNIRIDNSTFLNITSDYSPALYIYSSNCSIFNSRFVNLTAEISAGAIFIKEGGNHYIVGCEFVNTSSSRNAGAIDIDISGSFESIGNVTILGTLFRDTYSDFGGALIQLGGNLYVNNSYFINNGATYKGGSVYISFVGAEIENCTFDSNGIKSLGNITTSGSAIYCDISNLRLTGSKFIDKSENSGNAIYACDSSYIIVNSIFINNTNAIYTDFDRESYLDENNIYNNASVSTNNTFVLKTIIVGEATELKLINNAINVADLPSKFDLRDWNWVSSVENQGDMSACWSFVSTDVLESALRKACGITTDYSINNMQKTLIRYSDYGVMSSTEYGTSVMGPSYLLSWLGAFPEDYDTFDEVGKISQAITTGDGIHVQDVIFVYNDVPGSPQMKSAILKYGSLYAGFYLDQSMEYFNSETNAQYIPDNISESHSVAIVGWDDNYPKENFIIPPPDNGAWIIQNSWGTDWGDDGYMYLSYYDKSLLKVYGGDNMINPGGDNTYAMDIIIENIIPYNKNYQYDMAWYGIIDLYENVSYTSIFEASDDDLIAAVGTYFNSPNIDYRVDVYVNGELKLTQEGLSPYAGFHTIKLDEYIPIKRGDVFSAVMTSNAIPVIYLNDTRVHYTRGLSYKFENGNWVDLYDEGKIACLKVYTVADDSKIIGNKDITVDYGSRSYFTVQVVTADGHAVGEGATVKFTINGKSTTVKTNAKGIAKIKITEVPKKYEMTISFNGKSVKNIVTVNQVLKAKKVTVKKTAKRFTLKSTLKINGKLQKGKWITFKFNGKTYKVKTNSKGVAQKTLNKKVINKLKKGKTYTVKVTYLKDTIKTTVKVK